jgi:hypothetical protein
MKRNILIALGATALDIVGFVLITIICSLIMGEDAYTVALPIVFWLTVIVAIGTYLLCGGLKLALNLVLKFFKLGLLIPIWPIDWVCAITAGAVALMVVWMLPVVAVLLNGLLYAEE